MNARFRRNPLVRLLGSLQLMIILVLIFALGSAVATFIESAYGTPAARALVYDAFWFELTMILLMVNATVLLFIRMPYRWSQLGFLLVHISVIVILASAGITRFLGYEGMMHIREGQSSSTIFSSKDYLQLGAGEEEAALPVQLWKAGPSRAGGKLSLAGRDYRVRVLEYWPHYTERLQPDATGPATFTFAVNQSGQGMERHTLIAGEDLRVGGITFSLHADGLPAALATSRFGDLLVTLGGEQARLAVSRDPEASVRLGGYTLRVSEFHPDYARRKSVPEPEEMANPMIRVRVEGPGGASIERTLFALYPDFTLGGADEAFAELATIYDYGRRIELAPDGDRLQAMASFPVDLVDMSSQEVSSTLPAGEPFHVVMRSLYGAGELSLVPMDFWEHASLQAAGSDDPNAPAGVKVRVTGPDGASAETLIERGQPSPLTVGEEALVLVFGPREIELPYRLALDDFLLLTYPGSSNPASYESHVRLYDKAAGIDGRPVRIYMNHPLTYKGYKHFQSSYDQDKRGTVLSVNHDPGKWPTYIGYILIGLGFLLLMFKGLLSRFDTRSGQASKESA